MVMTRALAPVNTVVYGCHPPDRSTLPEGLAPPRGPTPRAKTGFRAVKAEPLAKAMGVSRGSFYWHFADIGAFHAAILKRWREVAAEQIIADVETASDNPLPLLLRRAFAGNLALENAVRSWATLDPQASAAVQAIDRRRLSYLEHLLGSAGVSPAG